MQRLTTSICIAVTLGLDGVGASELAAAAPPPGSARPTLPTRRPQLKKKKKRRDLRPVLRTTTCAKLFRPPEDANRPFQGQCIAPSNSSLGKVRRRTGSGQWIGTANKTFSCSGTGFTTSGGAAVSGIACEFDALSEPYTAVYTNVDETLVNVSSDVLANYMCGCYAGKKTGVQGNREAWNSKGFWALRVDGDPLPPAGAPAHLRLDPPAWPEPDRDVVLRRKPGFVMWYDKTYKRFHAKCVELAQRGVDLSGTTRVLNEGKVKRCGGSGSGCNRFDGTDQAVLRCRLSGSGDGDWTGRNGTCDWITPPPNTDVRTFEMHTSPGSGKVVHADDLARYGCGNYRPHSMAPFQFTGRHGSKESWSPSGAVWSYTK
ncbi:MAG: hypothetical protein AAF721_05730 [Myxococcota bacterium]